MATRPLALACASLMALFFCASCGPEAMLGGDQPDAGSEGEEPDAGSAASPLSPMAPGPYAEVPMSCDFGYDETFIYPSALTVGAPEYARPTRDHALQLAQPAQSAGGLIAHAEPAPRGYYLLPLENLDADLVMPDYWDDMPLFDRAAAWTSETRCFETPTGALELTEAQAYDLYRVVAEKTTGVALDTASEVRSVVGLRGAYPGTFIWHENRPNRFNDTLALLWIDSNGVKHAREFPVNTDTGAHDFGYHASSSLRANRRYRYINDWHRSYNALHIDEYGYQVRDDANKNGHWDSDCNGWLAPLSADDHDRTGGGHNIHMGSLDAPLGNAPVGGWSAGCQVIPGMDNWVEFITNAWTNLGDSVDYFLVDVRDIAPQVWFPCAESGTHACPYSIEAFPFVDEKDTSAAETSDFDLYNCSGANEAGPEVVYVFTADSSGTLVVSVDAEAPADPDIHLLDGDDPDACLARAHEAFEFSLTPGRYFIVVDTYVSQGEPLAGPYALRVDLE